MAAMKEHTPKPTAFRLSRLAAAMPRPSEDPRCCLERLPSACAPSGLRQVSGFDDRVSRSRAGPSGSGPTSVVNADTTDPKGPPVGAHCCSVVPASQAMRSRRVGTSQTAASESSADMAPMYRPHDVGAAAHIVRNSLEQTVDTQITHRCRQIEVRQAGRHHRGCLPPSAFAYPRKGHLRRPDAPTRIARSGQL